jgi:beta-carotene ketolase (CrtO type)
MDHGAIVVGAGHNGLICAAYLARAGIDTLLLEARDSVGGCASTEVWGEAAARANICNCDHVIFRTTPVMEELRLAEHGLRYVETDPSQVNMAWDGGPAWPMFHSVDRTVDALRRFHPDEADGYRRYAKAAVPVAELILELANEPPSPRRVVPKVLARRGRGIATLLSWSRKSADEVMRGFFRSDAVRGPALVTGPAVWGLSPATPGTGLGALTYALKHAGRPGRPVGGSGMVPMAVQAAFELAGGKLQTSAKVTRIVCDGPNVRGVTLSDGSVIEAPIVVVASDPTTAFLQWLSDPPPAAEAMIARWKAKPHVAGYESKLDVVAGELPRLSAIDDAAFRSLGVADPQSATAIISPSLDEMARLHALMQAGRIGERPMLFLNLPDVLDADMRPRTGDRIVSLEVIYTPYAIAGGWPGSGEPDRWLDALGALVQPGWRESVREMRAMTPDVYEREFHMPQGHATAFPGGPMAALLNREPELTRYETPVRGLYLSGAATFPGAGVWGASGRNCARTILRG